MQTISANNSRKKICLLGVSFDTGNQGVSALAASSVKCIIETCPKTHIVLLNYGDSDGFYDLKINSKIVRLELMNVSFSKRIWQHNHYLGQLVLAALYRSLPWKKVRSRLVKKSKYLHAILESDACLDISAGDSFSDVYGLYRLFYISSCKLLVLLLGKKLLLLPQTYGPFEMSVAKVVARHILRKASIIYSRDQAGLEYVRNLLNNPAVEQKLRFAPDVAFVLDPHKPDHIDIGLLGSSRTKDSILVGLNISGLLFNGGYTQNNMFGLKIDYRDLVCNVINLFMKNDKSLVLLVPHVFGPSGNIESDSEACLQVYKALGDKYKSRLFLVRGWYNQNEIKYVIGMCDFFVGSRMHACIAAMSQNIPTMGLAYTKKFKGVFQTIGIEHLAIDMRSSNHNEILERILEAYEQRNIIAKHLNITIPKVQEKVFEIFKGII